MADNSLNPEDRARLGNLETGLNNLGNDLAARLQSLERGVAESTQATERQIGRQAAAERDARRAGRVITGSGAGPRPAIIGETAEAQAQATGNAERLLTAEREIGAARARNLQLLEQQIARQRVTIPTPFEARSAMGGSGERFTPEELNARAAAQQAEWARIQTEQRTQATFRQMPLGLPRPGETAVERGPGGGIMMPPASGGGGGRPPVLPPAPPGPPEPPDRGSLRGVLGNKNVVEAQAREDEKLKAQEDALTQARTRGDTALTGLNARLAESTRTLSINGNALRAHGALTTEFIQAAAKGETTFAELGYQVGATVGKFAGWTAAAAAVYGALGAVQDLGTGAVQTLQGVNLLQRVVNNLNTDQAQRSFRDLALQFNLPIDEVVRTAYEASKAFKTQSDAMLATRAALYAVKIGEIDAADAGRYATAIVRGFHLQAADLIPVMNTVNALQNAFGSSFKDVAQGVAAGAGAFGAAGGSYQELAAAVATVTQVTGIQGANAATALRRTSELAFRPERRQGILDVLGLDTRSAATTIGQILDAAQREVAKGRSPLEVAKLITTPELASRAIAPLLASRQLYQARLTVAQNPGDSAERERRRAVASYQDQIARVGIEFQAIGSNLAQSGALNVFGGMLKGASLVLGTVNRLLDLFNELPKPVRETTMMFAELAGLVGLMRRFDVGATIAQRFPTLGAAFRRPTESAGRSQVLQGLGDERRWLQDQVQTVGRQRALADYQSIRAQQRHGALIDSGATDEELLASDQRRAELERRALLLSQEQADLQDRINVNMAQENAFRERTSIRGRQTVAEAAAAADITHANPTLNRNVPLRAVPVGAMGGSPEAPAPGRQFDRPIGPLTAGQQMEADAGKAVDLERQRNSLARAMEEQNAWFTRAGGSEGALSRSLGTVTGSAVFLGRATANTARSLRGFGTRLAESLNDPLMAIMAAFGIIEASYSYISQKVQETQRTVDSLNGMASSGASPADMARAARAELSKRSPFEAIQDAYASAHNFFADRGLGGSHITSPNQARDQAARDLANTAATLANANQHGVGLTRGQITDELNANLKMAGGDRGQISDAIQQATREAKNARGIVTAGTPAQFAKAQADIRDFIAGLKARQAGLAAVHESYDQAIAAATDTTSLGAVEKGLVTNIKIKGLNGNRAAAAGAVRARALELVSQLDPNASDYADQVSKFFTVMDDTLNGVEQEVTSHLQYALVSATPAQAAGLRQQAIAQVRSATVGGIQKKEQQLERRIRNRSREIDKAHQDLDRADSEVGNADGSGPFGALAASTQALANEGKKQASLDALKAAQQGDRKALDLLRQSMHMTREAFAQFIREQQQAAFDAQTALQESKTADPTAQADIALRRAQQAVANARAGKGTTTLVQAMTSANQQAIQTAAQHAQDFQQQQQLAQARQEASGAGQEAVLRSNVTRAQQYVAYLRGRAHIDPHTITQAQLGVYQAEKALNDFVNSNAQSLLDAEEQLALSRTEDPNRQAQIKVDYARRKLAEARASGDQSQVITQQAALNNAIRDRRNTAQQQRFEDIQFMADMGQIGKQTEISMLQSLLATMHGNRDLRRQIARQIYQLQHETSSMDSGDLTLGNIRLPSPYEVNRAIKEAGRAARGGANYNVQTNLNLQVNVGQPQDAEAVGRVIDRALGTSVATSLRFGR